VMILDQDLQVRHLICRYCWRKTYRRYFKQFYEKVPVSIISWNHITNH
jgi:hypothetical protein